MRSNAMPGSVRWHQAKEIERDARIAAAQDDEDDEDDSEDDDSEDDDSDEDEEEPTLVTDGGEPVATIDVGTTIFERAEDGTTYVEWYVTDLVWRDDGVSALLSRGDAQATVDVVDLEHAVGDPDDPAWVPSLYDGTDEDGNAVWVPDPNQAETIEEDSEHELDLRVAPDSPSDLRFEKIEGSGSRREVNTFLEGSDDGLVFHSLGGVPSWKAAFVARTDDGAIVSVVVVWHYHPSTNGEELAITRLANHTAAPPNTSSWMISHVRKWAERAGYETLATYADLDENDGTCYEAYGMEKVGEPEVVEGKEWTDEDDDAEWRRQKWEYDLDPATYADKSEDWATETVVDQVTVPGRRAARTDASSARQSPAA